MASPESIPCNVALLPSTELAERAIAASKDLERFDARFTLSSEGPFPHLSLYLTQLKRADLDRAGNCLAHIAARFLVFNLSANGYEQTRGYIDVDYFCTRPLGRIQMAVVDAIKPMRDGKRAKDEAKMPTATGLERENLERYGYRGVGELFRPHMTLARFVKKRPIDTSTLPAPGEFSGSFRRLGLLELGDNGTCMRAIAEFALCTADQ